MRELAEVIRGIRQTEKGTRLEPHGQYLFDVAIDENKIEIRKAVEELYNVKVTKVNTQIAHGKWRRLRVQWGRRPDTKRAIVSLVQGQKIEAKG